MALQLAVSFNSYVCTKQKSLNVKLHLPTSIVIATTVYTNEAQKSSAGTANKFDIFQQTNLRRILCVVVMLGYISSISRPLFQTSCTSR